MTEGQPEHEQRKTRKPQWQSVVLALAATLATIAGGGTFYIATDPQARPDAFTATQWKQEKEELKASFDSKIQSKTEFNRARWDEISKHIETQLAVIQSLRISVEGVITRCAGFSAADESLNAQINAVREQQRDIRGLLLDHITYHRTRANMREE